MNLIHDDITIRPAQADDAPKLCSWWNDGAVMAHAGFPKGLGTTVEAITEKLAAETDAVTRRHIILLRDEPIGEMNYHRLDGETCEMGIKICEVQHQNKGLGKIVLSMFIDGLFHQLGYRKVVLDTNLNNLRAQHVYEQLGFVKVRTNIDCWQNQLGELQSSVDYELTEDGFISWVR